MRSPILVPPIWSAWLRCSPFCRDTPDESIPETDRSEQEQTMAATTTAPSQDPVPRRRLSPQARVVVWIVRLVLLFVLIRVARNPWPLLHSRVFPAMLLWIGFSVYWSIAGRNSAPAKTPESRVS